MLASSSAKIFKTAAIISWVVVAFIGAQIAAGLLYVVAVKLFPSIEMVSKAVSATVFAAMSYSLAFGLIIAMPYVLKKGRVTLQQLGVQRWLSWSDIGVGALAVLPYIILTAVLTLVTTGLLGVDQTVKQAIPFENLVRQYEFIVAFLTLVVLAPIAEELIFRGYFLGKLKTLMNGWVAVFITAIVFGLMHLPGEVTDAGLTLQWAVAADTFALGFVLGSMRILTGSVWAGVLLHMLKNAVAYYFLFINPIFPGTM